MKGGGQDPEEGDGDGAAEDAGGELGLGGGPAARDAEGDGGEDSRASSRA